MVKNVPKHNFPKIFNLFFNKIKNLFKIINLERNYLTDDKYRHNIKIIASGKIGF